jgi:hypothetical protein
MRKDCLIRRLRLVTSMPVLWLTGKLSYLAFAITSNKSNNIKRQDNHLYVGPTREVETGKISDSNSLQRHDLAEELKSQSHAQLVVSTNNRVVLALQRPRRDRMGSRLQSPLAAWALSQNFRNWTFCTLQGEVFSSALGFNLCSEHEPFLATTTNNQSADTATAQKSWSFKNVQETLENSTTNGASVYFVSPRDNIAWKNVYQMENERPESIWNAHTSHAWREMILKFKKVNSTGIPKEPTFLWKRPHARHVAVHVRRGDVGPNTAFRYAYIPDKDVVGTIRAALEYIQRQTKKGSSSSDVEVHLFSEDYGHVSKNWMKQYEGLVDEFHLAPEGLMDVAVNIRDWQHFIDADILIVGGTFSAVPALARPKPSTQDDDDNDVGYPLTIYRANNHGYFGGTQFFPRHWVAWEKVKSEGQAGNDDTHVLSFHSPLTPFHNISVPV